MHNQEKNEFRLPDFYIAGTQKGGTTSLHFLLANHTQIYFPRSPQEIHFFDIESNYRKGASWLADFYSDAPKNAVTGLTSPFYMYLEHVPERIHALTPSVKFLFTLRNPVDRAYSHYWNSVRYGYESLSFEEAIANEPDRLASGLDFAKRHFSYIDRGRYKRQIERFETLFGKESTLVLSQDELRDSPMKVLDKCTVFLNITSINEESVFQDHKVHNPAKLPRSGYLQSTRPWLELHFPALCVRLLDKINLKESKYPPMSTSCRKRLEAAFAEDLNYLHKI